MREDGFYWVHTKSRGVVWQYVASSATPAPAMLAAGDAVMASDFIEGEDGSHRRPTAADVWKAMAEAGEGKR